MKKLISIILCLTLVLGLAVFASAAKDPATLSFADASSRTMQDENLQTWEANGIKLTNERGESTQPIKDYVNPIRLYAKTNVTIEYPGMTSIVLVCPTEGYAQVWVDNPGDAAATITYAADTGSANYIVTIAFAAPTNSYTVTNLAKQTRIREMTVYAGNESATPDTPVVPDEPETKPVIIQSGEYVIYAPAFNKALSSAYTGFYNNGVDVTLADGKLTGYTDAEIWTITCDENGIITISNGDNKLAMGAEYSSMPLNEVNDTWILEEAGDGLYYIKNAVRGNYVEWYDSKGNWSSYGTIGEGKEDLFKMALYSLVEEPVDPPVNPPVEDPEDPIPGTGDLGLGAVVVALMAATAGAVIIGKKKEF